MNQQQFKSLNTNVSAFCKPLSDDELLDLTDYLNFRCYENEKPNKLITNFIDEFFTTHIWNNNLHDEIEKPAYFSKASSNDKELIRLVRVGLMQECFFRFYIIQKTKSHSDEPKVTKPFISREEGAKLRANKHVSNILSLEDKKTLKTILIEHKAMLSYQLEDEDAVINAGGEELLEEKKKHKEFINKLGKSKLF